MDNDVLNRAIIVWTGWRVAPTPSRDEMRLAEEFGEVDAADLLPRLRALEDDFYRSNARHVAPNLVAMGELAANEFRELHPEISAEAVEALAWCYTFDYK